MLYRNKYIITLFILFFYSISFALITPNFTISNNKGCVPLLVEFTNTSTGIYDSCFWKLGINNNTSSLCNPSSIYNQAGIYTAELTVINKATGETKTISKKITVFKNPIVNFNATPRTGCVPFVVNFLDKTTLGDTTIKTWLWDMGDGSTEITNNPIHTYTFDGNLNISLIVVDKNGCTNTLKKDTFITKAIPPNIDFSASNTRDCITPMVTQFLPISNSTNLTYLWKFGNGDSSTISNPTANYIGFGNYNVSLTAIDQNNCKNTITKNNYIKSEPLFANFSIPNGCLPYNLKPSISSNYFPFTANWNFGNGITSNIFNPTISFTNANTYTVTLIASKNGACATTLTKQVTIFPSPTANFIVDTTITCGPFLANFTNQSIGANSYLWKFSANNTVFSTTTNANPNLFLPNAGSFSATLIATNTNGCVDSIVKNNLIQIIDDTLSIKANITEGCIPQNINFNATITNNNSLDSITWNFGDGTNGTGLNPSKIYADTGTFVVTATAHYTTPCKNKIQQLTIKLGDKYPFAGSFDLKNVCVHKETVTYIASGGISTTKFIWLYGDGQGEGRNTTHIYDDPSEPTKYMVKLIADNNTCKDTIDIDSIFVRLPLAQFNYTLNCKSRTINFSNTSRGNDTSWWNFGNTDTLIQSNNFNYTFPNIGTIFSVKLKVYNIGSGCFDTITKSIIFPENTNLISTNKIAGCKPLTVNFNFNGNDVANYFWDYGDGTITNTNNHTYNNSGNYNVKLYVTYNLGCSDTIYQTSAITVDSLYTNFSFTKSGNCLPSTLNLIDSSNSTYSNINNIKWQLLGKNTIVNNSNPGFLIDTTKADIKLVVSNVNGCKDSITKTVNFQNVKANFTINNPNLCTNLPVQFSSASQGINLQHIWNFGDGKTSNQILPTHIYNTENTFNVSLKVTDNLGCTDSVSKPNVINIKNLNANFSASPRFKSCPDLITNFSILPNNIDYNIINWNFGNGNTSNDTNKTPQAVYTIADSFDINLIVEDKRGCKDTVYKKDYIVVSGPNGSFDYFPNIGCNPLTVNLNVQFKNTSTTIWDFGNGDVLIDTLAKNNIKYIYNEDGIFTPSVVLKDKFGCTKNLVNTKSITVGSIDSKIIADKNYVCGNGIFTFTDSTKVSTTNTFTNRIWDLGDGNTNNNQSISYSYPNNLEKSYWIKLTTNSTLGCIGKDSILVNVFKNPTLTVNADKLICKNEQIQLNANGTKYYNWTPNYNIQNANTKNPTVKPDSTTTYIVKAYDTIFCPIFDSVIIHVKTKLNAIVSNNAKICIGDSAKLSVFAENTDLNNTTFTWTPNTNISSNKDTTPTVYSKITTTYNVLVKNGLCTPQNLPVKITVNPLPTVKADNDKIIIKGMQIPIDANSPNFVKYHWLSDYNISCKDCKTPNVSPEIDTNYMVMVTDSNSCVSTDFLRIRIIEDCTGDIVFLPNTFTPNNDGINDILLVQGPGIAKIKRFRIFNRWGELMFDTKDTNQGWDGFFKGESVNTGVYVYYLDVECIDGRITLKKGNVTVLK